MRDYLLTNQYSGSSIDKAANETAAGKGTTAGETVRTVASVAPEYLQAGLDEIRRDYGNVDRYLTDGLGLSSDIVTALHYKLT